MLRFGIGKYELLIGRYRATWSNRVWRLGLVELWREDDHEAFEYDDEDDFAA